MNNFQLIKNNLFKELSGTENHRPRKSDLSNTLKTVIPAYKSDNFNHRSVIYNRKTEFDIPREYSGLETLFIKCTLTCVGDPDPMPLLGARIFKSIKIRTKSGTYTLQTIYPEYTIARIDELVGKSLRSHIIKAVDPDVTFNNNTVSLVIPLFTWISNQNLDTRNLEQLTVECITNDNRESMGLLVDLTALSYDLYCHYNDPVVVPRSIKPVEMVVNDIFREPQILRVPQNASSVRCLLACPDLVFATHFKLVSDIQDISQIKAIKIETKGVVLVDLDKRMNYSLREDVDEVGHVEDGILTYYWGKERSRTSSSGLMLFSDDEMYPVVVELFFDPLTVASDLIIIHEIKKKLKINDQGQFSHVSTTFRETNALNTINI
jgi:hypothetical protein